MPYIHDTPSPPAPQDVPEESVTRRERILRTFYANAPPPLANHVISCTMHVTSLDPLEYDMRIIINRTSAPPRVQFLEPLGRVVVSYYTEGSVTSDGITPDLVEIHFLDFSDNSRMAMTFHANMHGVRWEEFLIVGFEFPASTINYVINTVNNRGEQGTRPGRIRSMQRLHLQTTFDRDSIYPQQQLVSEPRLLSNSESSSGPES
jgi:hypothetical protein